MYNFTYNTKLYNNPYPQEFQKEAVAKAKAGVIIAFLDVVILTITAVCAASPVSIVKTLKNITGKVNATAQTVKHSWEMVTAFGVIKGKVTKKMDEIVTAWLSATGSIGRRIGKIVRAIVSSWGNVDRHSSYQVEFAGNFSPGDVVVIDQNWRTVTVNGQRMPRLLLGRVPQLVPGDTTIIYEDKEGRRQVRVTVKRQNRWV